MTPRLPDSVTHGQPHSVKLGRHHQWVTENLKSVLRDNLRALLGLAPGKSGVSALIKLGLSNGNAQRALGGETSVGLDVIAQIAEAFSIEPWQLLVRGQRRALRPAIRADAHQRQLGLGLLHLALRACAHRHQLLNPIALSHLASL